MKVTNGDGTITRAKLGQEEARDLAVGLAYAFGEPFYVAPERAEDRTGPEWADDAYLGECFDFSEDSEDSEDDAEESDEDDAEAA